MIEKNPIEYFLFYKIHIATVRTNGSPLHETKQIKCKRKM